MEAVVGFIAKITTLAIEAATASEERLKQLAAEADEAWARCKAKVFKLDKTLDERNATNLERARELDRAARNDAPTLKVTTLKPAFDTSDVTEPNATSEKSDE